MPKLVAAVGRYGVIRDSVERRTRELGIRLALALASGRAIERRLYGIRGADLATFAFVIPLVLAIALLAFWLPARRAAQLKPIETLRYE